MDPPLAEAMARRLAAWMETAAQYARNVDYYRGQLAKCARHLGPAAYTSDDGTVQVDPLAEKIPDLVAIVADKAFRYDSCSQ